jgi:hypothetical protein
MNHVYDISAKMTSLNKELEYITAKKFFKVIQKDFELRFTKL